MRVGTFTNQRFAIAEMNRKQDAIGRLQSEISSGKQLLKPSDNPAQVAAVENLNASIQRLDQYKQNALQVEQRLNQEESVLDNLTDTLQRIKELSIAANSGLVNDNSLKAYRFELGELRNQLLDYANTRTATGEYLFSGAKDRSKPFSLSGTEVQYNGDQTRKLVQISDSRKVADTSTGDELFQRIINGNGAFSIAANPANTGAGVIGDDSVTDPTLFTGANYEITFASASQFDVVNTDTGATVLSGQSFSDGAPIRFDGIEIAISGQPDSGDRFTVSPSRNEDMFSIVNRFFDALSAKPNGARELASYHQQLNLVMADLDQALDHVGATRSELGAKLKYIDNTRAENESANIVLQRTRSRIQDTDLASAISSLQAESTSLDALRQSYIQFGSKTLFDYLR